MGQNNCFKKYITLQKRHRVAVIKEHLLKAVQRGYVDGTETGWAAIQDSMPQSPLE
jgi:hypothetical protein